MRQHYQPFGNEEKSLNMTLVSFLGIAGEQEKCCFWKYRTQIFKKVGVKLYQILLWNPDAR